MKRTLILALSVAANFAFIGNSSEAGMITVSGSAPTVDDADIAMLITAGGNDLGGTAGHVWNNRPLQGQSFSTLSDPSGYLLDSVTLQHRGSTISNNTATFTVRIGTVSGTTFTPIALEDSNNTISYNPGNYITFNFDSQVALLPNTVYGFDWDTTGDGFVTNNNDDSFYTGGTGFHHGANGIGDDMNLVFPAPGNDRVFHINLTTAPVPEPSSMLLAVLCIGGLTAHRIRRRRRSDSQVDAPARDIGAGVELPQT